MAKETVRAARSQDVEALIDIYTECFPKRVMEVFGRPHRRTLIRDYLLFYLSWDPRNNWVAVMDEEILGFVIAPCQYSPVRALLTQGQIWHWLWHLLTGKYGLPLHIFKLFLASGFAFNPDPVIQRMWGKPTIHLCAIRPAYQGRGIGSRLMNHALTAYQQAGVSGCWLVVEPHNLQAIALYKKFGFDAYETVSQGEIVMVLGSLNRPGGA
jgi:ribosomal protein S18 acetylase RimI-like enzyme